MASRIKRAIPARWSCETRLQSSSASSPSAVRQTAFDACHGTAPPWLTLASSRSTPRAMRATSLLANSRPWACTTRSKPCRPNGYDGRRDDAGLFLEHCRNLFREMAAVRQPVAVSKYDSCRTASSARCRRVRSCSVTITVPPCVEPSVLTSSASACTLMVAPSRAFRM